MKQNAVVRITGASPAHRLRSLRSTSDGRNNRIVELIARSDPNERRAKNPVTPMCCCLTRQLTNREPIESCNPYATRPCTAMGGSPISLEQTVRRNYLQNGRIRGDLGPNRKPPIVNRPRRSPVRVRLSAKVGA